MIHKLFDILETNVVCRRKIVKSVAVTGVATSAGILTTHPVPAQEIEYGALVWHEESDTQPPQHSINFGVSFQPEIEFTEQNEFTLEIERIETGETIRLHPQDSIDIPVTSANFALYDGDGTLFDPPEMTVSGDGSSETVPLSVIGGNEDIFVGGNVFDNYVVHLVENGDRIDSMEEKLIGIGYEGEFEQSVTAGEIEASIPIEPEVDDSYYVSFRVRDHGSSPPTTIVEEREMERDDGADRFVTTFHTDDLGTITSDSVPRADIRFFEGGNPAENPDIIDGDPNLWIGFSLELDEEGVASAIFRQTAEASDNPMMLVSGGAATAGLGYLAYRNFQASDETETTKPTAGGSIAAVSESPTTSSLTIDGYDDLNIADTVERHSTVKITKATANNKPVWVLTPVSDGDTIDTDQFNVFLDCVDPWANMDDNQRLLSVHAHGSEPLPWVAIEPADGPTLQDQTTDLTTEETIQLLAEACEGVHHVQRYGLAYEHLSPDSVLIDDTTAKLRGVLDHVIADNAGYELPNTKEDPTTEQADVYRLGALVYEVLTGSKPARQNPTPPSEWDSALPDSIDEVLLRALAETPKNRYETVLHLRDELQDRSSGQYN